MKIGGYFLGNGERGRGAGGLTRLVCEIGTLDARFETGRSYKRHVLNTANSCWLGPETWRPGWATIAPAFLVEVNRDSLRPAMPLPQAAGVWGGRTNRQGHRDECPQQRSQEQDPGNQALHKLMVNPAKQRLVGRIGYAGSGLQAVIRKNCVGYRANIFMTV